MRGADTAARQPTVLATQKARNRGRPVCTPAGIHARPSNSRVSTYTTAATRPPRAGPPGAMNSSNGRNTLGGGAATPPASPDARHP